MIPVKIIFSSSDETDEKGFKGVNPLKIGFPDELICKPTVGDYVAGFLPDGTVDVDSFIVTDVHHSFSNMKNDSSRFDLDEPIIEVFVRWYGIESKNYISAVEEIKKLKEELENTKEEMSHAEFIIQDLKGELIAAVGVPKAKEVWGKINSGEEEKENGETPSNG